MQAFDHKRIRYKYLTPYVASVHLYTRRYPRFNNTYRCYEIVVTSSYKNDPEVNFVTFCTKNKTGKYLCSEPIFPEYKGKSRSRQPVHNELYRNMLLLQYKIANLKEDMAEHRQKMIEMLLPSAFSFYEEALFQN